MSVKRLIVNADDFGRTTGVNRGVIEAHRQGVVTSATMMVGFPGAPEAAALARETPALGVGLHLALTGGPPTLPPERLPSLVDARGMLPAKPEALGAARPAEVLAEARGQLRRFRELMGRDPTHFDSHHHAHRTPLVYDVFATLAWETGLPVRNGPPGMAERLRREGIATTDHFVESFYDAGVSLEVMLSILDDIPPGVTELMCHPAVVDEELRAGSSYAEQRSRELEILTHREVRQALQALGIKLVSFADLAAGGAPS
ncbi:MAG TPA: chitin disaccharide deacetylase [Vicinamibacteria bacterium]